jgi:cytochrome P450
MQKDPDHYQKHDKTPSLHVSNDSDHTRMRKLIAHAFSEKALREQEPIMQSYTDLFVQRMYERSKEGNPVNIKKWIYWLLFDVFGDLCFGESFGCLREEKSHPWIDIMSNATQSFAWIGLARRVPYFGRYAMKLIPKEKIEQAAWHSKFSSDMADKRLAMKTDRPDFMSFILRYNDDRGLTVPELRSNSNSLVAGGSDTTGTFLTGTIWNLLKNPATYKSLTDEIRGTFKSVDEITIVNLGHLKYLTAVINEGLRVYPPVPSPMPRVIVPEGGMVCGKWLPGGVCYPRCFLKLLLLTIGYYIDLDLRRSICHVHEPYQLHGANIFHPRKMAWRPKICQR